MKHIDQLKNIGIDYISTYPYTEGGIAPSYWLYREMARSPSAYTKDEHWRLLVKAIDNEALNDVINDILSIHSKHPDGYSQKTTYSLSVSEKMGYITTDGTWTDIADYDTSASVRYNYGDTQKIASAFRFTSVHTMDFKDIDVIYCILPMNTSVELEYVSGKTTYIYFAKNNPTSLVGITTKATFDLSTEYIEVDIAAVSGVYTPQCLSGYNYVLTLTRVANPAWFAELDTLPNDSELILWLQPKAVNGTYRRYATPTATLPISNAYPYHIEVEAAWEGETEAELLVKARWNV